MKFRKLLALLLVALLLSGCGAAKDSANSMAEIMDAGTDGEMSNGTTADLPTSQKLIRKVWMETETENLDDLLNQVNTQISQTEGYIEEQEVYHGSAYSGRRYRHAVLTIRVPAEKLDEFANNLAEVSNIISSRETTEDITLTYVATESQKIALETEQTRLLELLAQAESLADVLKIEERLTEIRGQLEGIISQLRVYDNQVNYSTIYLTISEVTEYTDTTEPETLWDRLVRNIASGWEAFGDFWTGLLLLIAACFPFLLLIAAIVVLLILRRKRKKKKAPEAPVEQTQKDPEE